MIRDERRTAFILAAGLGTRLKEMTSDRPKALVKVNQTPLLQMTLESLISQGFNHFVINIHHFGEKILDFLNCHRYKDIVIEISDERVLLMNTGGALLQALPYFKKSKAVLIHNVDILTDVDLRTIYDDFSKTEEAVWLLTQNRENKRKLVFDHQQNFIGNLNLETKEYNGNVPYKKDFNLLSFSGLHLIKPKFFKDFEVKPCPVFKLYRQIAQNHIVKSFPIQPSYWFDLGTKERIKEASLWLSSQK